MSRAAFPGDLATASQLAEVLNVHPNVISNWQKRDIGFPEPWGVWPGAKLWLLDEVIDWHAARQADLRARREKRKEQLRAQLEKFERHP